MMCISFEIRDVTSLTGDREQKVDVTALSCESAEIDLSKRLTDAVVREVRAYVEERCKKTDKEKKDGCINE